MQDAEISWGTVFGQGPTGIFCSAHENNLIVLPPGNSTLLAPLDFDQAYDKNNFISLDKNLHNFGKFDEELFSDYLVYEITRLIQGLCSRKNNNDYIKDDEYYKQLSLENKILDCLLCFMKDILLEAYMLSFDKIKIKHLKDNLDILLYSIVKIALLTTYEISS